MNTKLTLRMDESLIAAAKNYAAAHGSSVSQMVASYFAALGQKAAAHTAIFETGAASQAALPDNWRTNLGPVTRSLIGILKAKPGEPQVAEDDYYAYLERKYAVDDSATQSGAPS